MGRAGSKHPDSRRRIEPWRLDGGTPQIGMTLILGLVKKINEPKMTESGKVKKTIRVGEFRMEPNNPMRFLDHQGLPWNPEFFVETCRNEANRFHEAPLTLVFHVGMAISESRAENTPKAPITPRTPKLLKRIGEARVNTSVHSESRIIRNRTTGVMDL